MSNTISPVFRLFQTELDSRHDKYERLVKLSRDITVASKRTIFSIHRASSEGNEERLVEIGKKISELECTKWHAVARELQGEDQFQYLRAYSPGMQEYIEAVALWQYVAKRNIIGHEDIQQRLTFAQDSSEDVINSHSVPMSTSNDTRPPDVPGSTLLTVYIPPAEYVLGMSDVAGELMRIAVHSVGVGDKEMPFVICHTLRELCTAMSSLYGIARDLPHKLSTLRQSVAKVEAACYAIHVRGSELPDHLLTSMLTFKPTVLATDDLESVNLD